MVNCQKEMDSLWAQLKDLRDAAAKNRETLGELGAIVVQEPAWFSYRTFGVNQGNNASPLLSLMPRHKKFK